MIDGRLLEDLRAVEGLTLRHREPMAAHCLWRVGGPALYLVAETEAAAKECATLCSKAKQRLRPYDGPRTLVRDGGDDLGWLRFGTPALGFEVDDAQVQIGAQLPAAVAARRMAVLGLSGLEALTGQSGTVADAVRSGQLQSPKLRAMRGRRISVGDKLGDGHHLLAVLLPVVASGAEVVQAAGRGVQAKRRGIGPGLPGSLLQNPKRGSAAERMAESGLCGVRLRGLQIGLHEPNTVINRSGEGSVQDLLLLLKLSQDRVKSRTGVVLESALNPKGRNASSSGPRRGRR